MHLPVVDFPQKGFSVFRGKDFPFSGEGTFHVGGPVPRFTEGSPGRRPYGWTLPSLDGVQ